MAQVSHPNVVSVYDVELDEQTVVLAMEYIEGPNLRAWLKKPRTWSEIVDVFIGAGRGLSQAHTAGLLHHTNILEVYDAGVDDDVCYIVMELVENGDTLKPFCNPSSLLPVADAVEVVFKCAKALDYAHREGVIHRDIKPSNILLTETGEVKIADFSIAHVTKTDLTDTMPMGFVGSPRYMSPEQVQEDEITYQTDIFSLGVVAYELLTGRHPFASDSFSGLIHKVINERPAPMREARSELPEVLDRIIGRAVEKDPARRYRMGLDLASELSVAFTHLERPQEDISSKEKFDYVRSLAFFKGFTDAELWEIIRAAIWQEATLDEAIIQDGAIEDWFYILTSGRVRVVKNGQTVSQLKEGDCFGEMGYINRTRRTADVIANGPVSLMKINLTLLEQVTQECQIRFYKVFMRIMTERLSHMTELVAAR